MSKKPFLISSTTKNNNKNRQLKSTWKHAHFIVTLKKDPEPTNDMFVIINIIPVKKNLFFNELQVICI